MKTTWSDRHTTFVNDSFASPEQIDYHADEYWAKRRLCTPLLVLNLHRLLIFYRSFSPTRPRCRASTKVPWGIKFTIDVGDAREAIVIFSPSSETETLARQQSQTRGNDVEPARATSYQEHGFRIWMDACTTTGAARVVISWHRPLDELQMDPYFE